MGQYTEAMIPLVRQVIRDELGEILNAQTRSHDGLRKALVGLVEAELDERYTKQIISLAITSPPSEITIDGQPAATILPPSGLDNQRP